ncbi:tetratricopeptide repeat protein [Pseudoduganella namucuonensis]|uniref:Tetratricopeptide repeat-containing protein n=1 Tax=Pseudoduganella namucuonensis TaxID=1035707 RepID=A0A1I7L6I9_9BURK|nr:tetratricopeptide repeat protein [Pseudoduganella namucuonensis]SFV05126.1 Tetratricopeptide repeat-containing protein [Pseudoduganella namucuonensis]
MSLLMQALKKAERNRQDALPDEDMLEPPSAAFDDLLALTPQDVIQGRVPPSHAEFTLEPLDEQRPPGSADRRAPRDDKAEEQIPALLPAEEVLHDPTPPQSRREPARGVERPAELSLQELTPLHLDAALSSAEPANPLSPLSTSRPMTLDLELHADATPLALQVGPADKDLADLGAMEYAPPTDAGIHAATRAGSGAAGGFDPDTASASATTTATGAAAVAAKAAGNVGGGTAPHSPSLSASGYRAASAPSTGIGPGGVSAGPVIGAAGEANAGTAGSGSAAATTASTATAAGTAAGASKPPSGAAARARAAAARTAAEQDKVGWDPARVRLAALSTALVLILALFGYIYWRATSSPGPGAALPMVPMPPPNATGAAPALVVTPPAGSPEAIAGSGAPGDPGVPPADAVSPSADAAAGYPPVPAPGAAQPVPSPAPGRPSDVAGAIQGARTPPDADLQRALQQAAAEQAAMAASAAAEGRPPQPGPTHAMPAAQPAQQSPGWSVQAASPSSQPGGDIKVTRSSAPPRISPVLQSGYQAFTAGDLTAAAQHYDAALRQEPNNRDALLGHAAVAVRQNASAQAASTYMRLLELNPSDPDALAGLLSLRPGDTGQSETRMKDLLRRSPDSGPLLFALGNLYARQARWTDAQQAYFRAYSASPDNPDYAFNLAVGLDRLNQRKLALTYYERALALAQAGPAAFDREAVRLRTRQLLAPPAPPAAPANAPAAVPMQPATEAAADGYRP